MFTQQWVSSKGFSLATLPVQFERSAFVAWILDNVLFFI